MGMNQRVTIMARTAGEDALGQPVNTWVDLVSLWADVRYLSGIETIRADAPASLVKASVRIRQRAGITDRLRVRHGQQVLDIKAVLPDTRTRMHMDLVCEGVQL